MVSEFDKQTMLREMGADADYGDPEQNYCDNCWREMSSYQCTVGEGFCEECAAINEEKDSL